MNTIEPSGANQNDDTAHGRKDSEVPAKISIKRSGGPRTEPGKEKSSRNATKHGIFSAVVLEGRESKQKYQKILRALIEYFKPEGHPELILVERLAALLWRQSRLVRAESAEILNESLVSEAFKLNLTSMFPSEIALERIIRYEAHLSREFDRTLQQLERLKRIRTGQATLPPIEVKLSA